MNNQLINDKSIQSIIVQIKSNIFLKYQNSIQKK